MTASRFATIEDVQRAALAAAYRYEQLHVTLEEYMRIRDLTADAPLTPSWDIPAGVELVVDWPHPT